MVRTLVVVAILVASGCAGHAVRPEAVQHPSRSASPARATPLPSATTPATATLGTVAPVWLGKRPLPLAANGLGAIQPTPPELHDRAFTLPDTLDPLPGSGFASRVDRVPAEVLARSSWSPRCPVAAENLRWVRLVFWGFDGRRHTGELLANADAAPALVDVFRQLYAARFPLEEMRITRADEIDAPPTGDGNNTGSFTCKPLRGSTTWSEHAYGRAVDVNPFDNPYVEGDVLIPELASAYLDRSRQAAGMIHPADVVTRAFSSVGWTWGGNWRHSKDFMHFSANGR